MVQVTFIFLWGAIRPLFFCHFIFSNPCYIYFWSALSPFKPFETPNHRCHRIVRRNLNTHMHMIRHQTALYKMRHSCCRASSWKIGPRNWRISPNITFRRYLGTKTTWYLQSHLEWDRLWYNSDIGFSSYGELVQATVGGTWLLERSKLIESHWSNQWLTSEI